MRYETKRAGLSEMKEDGRVVSLIRLPQGWVVQSNPVKLKAEAEQLAMRMFPVMRKAEQMTAKYARKPDTSRLKEACAIARACKKLGVTVFDGPAARRRIDAEVAAAKAAKKKPASQKRARAA